MDVGQEFVFRFGPALSMYRSGISFLFNTGIAKPAVRNEVAWNTSGSGKPKHLPAYLDEYVFRFNRRKSTKRGLLFYRLLENAMNTSPVTLEELLK